MWIDHLPQELQAQAIQLVSEYPKSEEFISRLVDHFITEEQAKRRKVPSPEASAKTTPVPSVKPEEPLAYLGPTLVQAVSEFLLNITSKINSQEIIFELSALSFLSPIRKKLSLVFHLYINPQSVPLPALSLVNPATGIPEYTLTNLKTAVKLCMAVPILGNTTVSTKKDTVLLAIWLHDPAALNADKNEPIICALNLDVIKKQLVQAGKIPPNAESQISHISAKLEAIKPINELIIDFLQRQFSLCGVHLLNFLPSANPGKNVLNMNDDHAICVSANGSSHNDLVMATAYRRLKEGCLLLVLLSPTQAVMIFGFKKPVQLIDFASIREVSYRDITRFTFSIIVTLVDASGKEETIEFGMVDQISFQAIDEFVKRMNIEDNSFDAKNREKGAEKNDAVADDGAEIFAEADGSDEEEDESYTGDVQEGQEASGSESEDGDFNSGGSDSSGESSGDEEDSLSGEGEED